MERKEKMGKQGECGADQEASQEAPRTRFVYNGTGAARAGPRSAPSSVWGDLWRDVPGLSFLACETGRVTSSGSLTGLRDSGKT